MASLLDIDLEQIAKVVERGTGAAEMALLFDGGRLRVALGHDEAAQGRALLSGDFLPGGFAAMFAKTDLAIAAMLSKENAPAILGHLHVAEGRPTLRVDRRRGSQIDIPLLETLGTELAPPVEESRLPFLERALQPAVVRERDVVGNLRRIVD